jgi:glycosyltransferase involved in cell wall biosynthesis
MSPVYEGKEISVNFGLDFRPKESKGLKKASQEHSIYWSAILICVPFHIVFLPEILEDLRNQTRPYDEIVIVASGFSKKQLIWLRDLRNQLRINSEIKVVNAKSQSAGANRNLGVKFTTGNLLSFLDADDRYHPERNQILLKYFEDSSTDALVHASLRFNNSKRSYANLITWMESRIPANHEPLVGADELFMLTFPEGIRNRSKEMLGGVTALALPAKYQVLGVHHGHLTLRRDVFNQLQGFHHFYYPRNEDSIFLRDLLWQEYNVAFLPKPLSGYRVSSSTSNKRSWASRIKFSPLWAAFRFIKYYLGGGK